MTPNSPVGRFVTVSGIAVPAHGAQALEDAMRGRIGLVEDEPGFGGLQVWRPTREGDPYRMVTWWDGEQAFRDYMRSSARSRSHARRPGERRTGPHQVAELSARSAAESVVPQPNSQR